MRYSFSKLAPLVHGPNWGDLDGDGHKDLVMKTLNEFAFIKTAEFKASKSYCSVINAFKAELGLPGGDPALDDYDYEPATQ